MASKMVTDRQKIGDAVRHAAEIHAESATAQLSGVLTPLLQDGETLPDLALLQKLPARLLEARKARMTEADDQNLIELTGDSDPRRRRDQAAEEVYSRLVKIRETVAALFGADRARDLLRIEGLTARDPVVLHRRAALAVTQLSAAAEGLPPMAVEGVTVDVATLVAKLGPAVEGLGAALEEVGRERRRALESLRTKARTIAAYDEATARVGRFLVGLYGLAGLDEFAQRVRLTLPRVGRRNGELDPGGGPAPERGEDSPPPVLEGTSLA